MKYRTDCLSNVHTSLLDILASQKLFKIIFKCLMVNPSGSVSGRSGGSDMNSGLLWYHEWTQSLYWPSSAKIREEDEVGQRKCCTSKHDYTTSEKQPESLIYEAVPLILIDDSVVKLTRNGEPNNLYLHLANEGHWQRKWKAADLHPQQKSLNGSLIISSCLPITQWPVSTATVVDIMSRPRSSNWLVRLLSIRGQVSLIEPG